MVDEIAFAMKSCFAGVELDGFDFIQGFDLGFHLNEVKISSLLCNDFINPAERENISTIKCRNVLSLSALTHKVADKINTESEQQKILQNKIKNNNRNKKYKQLR